MKEQSIKDQFPPIQEAIIEIRYVRPLNIMSATATAKDCGFTPKGLNPTAGCVALLNEDGTEEIQFREDRASYHFTGEYRDGSIFIARYYETLGKIYKEVAEETTCNRVGLRYANLIESIRPDDVSALVVAPVGLHLKDSKAALAGVEQRYALAMSNDVHAIVQLAIGPGLRSKGRRFDVVFDIDVFRAGNIEIDETPEALEDLREAKNEIFNANLKM